MKKNAPHFHSFIFSLTILALAVLGCKDVNFKPSDALNLQKEDYYGNKLDSIINFSPEHLAKERAIFFLDSLFKQPGFASEKGKKYMLSFEGLFCKNFNDFSRIFDFINTNIQLYEAGKITDPELYYMLYLTRGDCFMMLGKFKEAYDDYLKIKPIWDVSTPLDCEKHNFLHRLGMISYRQEQYVESRTFFKESLGILNQMCDTTKYRMYTRKQELINNIGLTFLSEKQADSALFYFEKAHDFIIKIDLENVFQNNYQKLAQAITLKNIGNTYLMKNEYETANFYIKNAADTILKYQTNKNDKVSVLTRLNELNLIRGDLEYFKKNEEEIQRLLPQVDNVNTLKKYYDILYQYYTTIRKSKIKSA